MMQEQNIKDTIRIVNHEQLTGKNILLIDDVVNSRWTMTVIASQLLESADKVYPFALINNGSE